MSDIFDGGGVGATAPSEPFGGLLSQPPLSPAVDRPAPTPTPTPTMTEPEPDPVPAPAAAAPAEPVAAETDPNAPGMLERKLLQYGLVTMDQLGEAMREEAATGRPVAGILIERGWVTQAQIAQLFEPVQPPAAAPEPVAAPAAPAPLPITELAPEPVPEPSFLDEAPAAPTPDPVPVAVPAPEPVAPPAPEPVAPPAPEPVAEAVEPEPVLAAPDPAPIPAPAGSSSLAFHLYIRLSTGERIDANVFGDLNDARLHAEDLVKKLSTNSHVWPHFGGRYIRPEAIISIDVEAAPV